MFSREWERSEALILLDISVGTACYLVSAEGKAARHAAERCMQFFFTCSKVGFVKKNCLYKLILKYCTFCIMT